MYKTEAAQKGIYLCMKTIRDLGYDYPEVSERRITSVAWYVACTSKALGQKRIKGQIAWHLKLQPSQYISEHVAKQFGQIQMVHEVWMQTLEKILTGLLKSPSTKQES